MARTLCACGGGSTALRVLVLVAALLLCSTASATTTWTPLGTKVVNVTTAGSWASIQGETSIRFSGVPVGTGTAKVVATADTCSKGSAAGGTAEAVNLVPVSSRVVAKFKFTDAGQYKLCYKAGTNAFAQIGDALEVYGTVEVGGKDQPDDWRTQTTTPMFKNLQLTLGESVSFRYPANSGYDVTLINSKSCNFAGSKQLGSKSAGANGYVWTPQGVGTYYITSSGAGHCVAGLHITINVVSPGVYDDGRRTVQTNVLLVGPTAATLDKVAFGKAVTAACTSVPPTSGVPQCQKPSIISVRDYAVNGTIGVTVQFEVTASCSIVANWILVALKEIIQLVTYTDPLGNTWRGLYDLYNVTGARATKSGLGYCVLMSNEAIRAADDDGKYTGIALWTVVLLLTGTLGNAFIAKIGVTHACTNPCAKSGAEQGKSGDGMAAKDENAANRE